MHSFFVAFYFYYVAIGFPSWSTIRGGVPSIVYVLFPFAVTFAPLAAFVTA